jgi:hypothetical protein
VGSTAGVEAWVGRKIEPRFLSHPARSLADITVTSLRLYPRMCIHREWSGISSPVHSKMLNLLLIIFQTHTHTHRVFNLPLLTIKWAG